MKVEDLKNTKIYLSNEEDRIKFQKKVFKLGVKWSEGDQSVVDNTNGDMFFIIDNYLHLFLDWGKTSFINNRSKQIFLEDVLAIEEPVSLVTGMPVLVRDDDTEGWEYNILGRIRSDEHYYKYRCVGGAFYQCIPYEGNEHLLGTSCSFSY